MFELPTKFNQNQSYRPRVIASLTEKRTTLTYHFNSSPGVSHGDNLTLFQVGALASKPLQQYAELGRADEFEATLNHSLVLSQFYAPPIRKGVGLTSSSFFVDAQHSKVNLLNISNERVKFLNKMYIYFI